ncbi:uncharacterized protein METZ01_LOCUS323299, partial [marine metagenome]
VLPRSCEKEHRHENGGQIPWKCNQIKANVVVLEYQRIIGYIALASILLPDLQYMGYGPHSVDHVLYMLAALDPQECHTTSYVVAVNTGSKRPVLQFLSHRL